jgi:hypothetical protein
MFSSWAVVSIHSYISVQNSSCLAHGRASADVARLETFTNPRNHKRKILTLMHDAGFLKDTTH